MLLPKLKLYNYLSGMSKFAATRSPLEMYSKLRIKSVDGKVVLQAQNNNGIVIVNTGFDGDVSTCVDFSTFMQVVGAFNSGDIEVEGGSKLLISAGSTKTAIPVFDLEMPRINDCSPDFEMGASEWITAVSRMTLDIGTESSFAPGIRILREGSTVSFLCSTGAGMCGYDIDCEGGNFDATCPKESIDAATSAIRKSGGERVMVGMHNHWVYLQCGDTRITIPTVGGKMARKRSAFEGGKPINEWKVPREELIEALRQAKLFTDKEASGIDLAPAEDGLHVVFNGLANDGTTLIASGSSETIIPGVYEGDRAIVDIDALLSMLRVCDDEYRLFAGSQSVCVESGGYFAAYACMTRRGVA